MPEAYFEPLERRSDCSNCAIETGIGKLGAVYCISLQEQPERAQYAADYFHRIGLCSHVTFFRPRRAKNPRVGAWESHAAVAAKCLERGLQNALILEDDVRFTMSWARARRRIDKALTDVPETWRGLYVGHQPYHCYFVRPRLLRSMSTLMHAYVANRPLLEWLPYSARANSGVIREFSSIDFALREMEEMYAMFPMIARQRVHGQSFHSKRWQEWVHHVSRPIELYAVSRSASHFRYMQALPRHYPYLRETKFIPS